MGSIWTGIVAFNRGPNGEVYMPSLGGFEDSTDIDDNDGIILRLAAATVTQDPPSLLSQTGAFIDLPSLTPTPAFIPYGVPTPLWSDTAVKDRWIALPNDGDHSTSSEQNTFSETENWVFPAGTVLMKHFELPTDQNNPTQTVRLETRFIICTENGGKYGVTYRWLPDQTDVVLLTSGETGDYTITETGGSTHTQTWTFPSHEECFQCHNEASGQALGVRTHQLNGYYPHPKTASLSNQLYTWSELGMFDQTLTKSQIENFIQSRGISDTETPLEHRVRSYLDSNCSHCHRPGGPGGNFDARLTTHLLGQSIVGQEPSFFQTLAPDGRYITPMDVANSIIHFRMDHSLPSNNSMPPLAKALVDDDAVQLVSDWINAITPTEFPTTPTQIRSVIAGPTSSSGDFYATIILDDDVSDFTSSDLSLTNGAVLNFEGSRHYYTVRIRPTGNPVTVELPASSATGDNTGLPNSPSNLLSVNFFDDQVPTGQFGDLPTGDLSVGISVTIGIDFKEAVAGLVRSDFNLTNSTSSKLKASGILISPLTMSALSIWNSRLAQCRTTKTKQTHPSRQRSMRFRSILMATAWQIATSLPTAHSSITRTPMGTKSPTEMKSRSMAQTSPSRTPTTTASLTKQRSTSAVILPPTQTSLHTIHPAR